MSVHTPAAWRAAGAICDKSAGYCCQGGMGWSLRALVRLIDEETGLPELLAAAQKALEAFRPIAASAVSYEGRVYRPAIEQLERAIAKAGGPAPGAAA